MKQKLSKIIKDFSKTEKDILKAMNPKVASEDNVLEFSALSGIPLVFIYYTFITKYDRIEFQENLNRLCDFYNIENDIKEGA